MTEKVPCHVITRAKKSLAKTSFQAEEKEGQAAKLREEGERWRKRITEMEATNVDR